MRTTQLLPALLLALLLLGCGPQMRTIPVGEGNVQIHGSLGGPMVSLDGPAFPVPYGMTGVTFGVSDHLDLCGDFHVAPAVFKFLGLTPGIVWYPAPTASYIRPAISANALIFSDFHDSRVYPELVTTVAFGRANHATPYLGCIHTFQTNSRPEYLPSVVAGFTFPGRHQRLVIELQALAVNFRQYPDAPNFASVNNRGAIALQLGYGFTIAGGSHE